MNKVRIQQLVRLMPEKTTGIMPGIWPATSEPLSQRLASAMNDPGFGNKFVRAFVSRRQPLPTAVHESCLRRAYSHYASMNTMDDMIMVEIEQLLYPENHFNKAVLEALLISRDVSIAQIAEWVSLGVEVIQVYEQLYFNVRDRMGEKAYIAALALPGGRVELLRTDAADDLSFAQHLLQAGHLYGANEVLVLAGMDTNAELPSVEQSAREFEASIMYNASLLVRGGRQNSTMCPGIGHAKQLITARRNAALQTSVFDAQLDPLAGLGMTPGDAINYTVSGIMADADPNATRMPPEDDDAIRAAVQAQRQDRAKAGNGTSNNAN